MKKRIKNGYNSYCVGCKQLVPKGEECLWIPGKGVKHIECDGVIKDKGELRVNDEAYKGMWLK